MTVVTSPALSPVHAYHDGTKHHFNRFARSMGYLDWASQPRPFRSFAGAQVIPLYPRPDATPQSGLREPQAALSIVEGRLQADRAL